MASSTDDNNADAPTTSAESKEPSKRFRFKRKHDHGHSDRKRSRADDRASSDRQRTRHHHRNKRRRTSSRPLDDPSSYDDSVAELPPDVAFRESLFDAMGDDEGAAYWEGVYGYPIHSYPNTYQNQETGELEKMNDEEYAQFVRRKMWERSWEGIEAAKEEKRREREQEKERIREKEKVRSHDKTSHQQPDFLFDLDIEQSLRRGERRKDKRRWKKIWDDYLKHWTELQDLRDTHQTGDDAEQIYLRNKIAWPVESGKRKDVNVEQVERFFKKCTDAIDSSMAEYLSMLKSERVRWHPDKIQQRYGFMDIDETTTQGVTAVFQIFDNIWNHMRNKD